MKKINEFRFIDHGIKYTSYFKIRNIFTGIGNNPAEAINNCLNKIMEAGFDIRNMVNRIMEENGWTVLPLTPNTDTYNNVEDINYFVSIELI